MRASGVRNNIGPRMSLCVGATIYYGFNNFQQRGRRRKKEQWVQYKHSDRALQSKNVEVQNAHKKKSP